MWPVPVTVLARGADGSVSRIEYILEGESGRIDPKSVVAALRKDTLLVSVMHANNETGILQPIAEIAEVLADHDAYLHVDAAQSFGKEIETLRNARIDLISASAHKLYGPKGVGALYVSKEVSLIPLIHGGGQERGLRASTENVPGIVGFGKAAEIAMREMEKREREQEARLAKARKLESLGVMAGGIAHDFNNLLAVIMANADMARSKLREPDRVADHLDGACEAASQAAQLCQQLLVYAGRGRLSLRPVDVNEMTSGTLEILEVTMSNNVAIDLTTADDLPAVQGDPTQLRQILQNLVTNAADAITVFLNGRYVGRSATKRLMDAPRNFPHPTSLDVATRRGKNVLAVFAMNWGRYRNTTAYGVPLGGMTAWGILGEVALGDRPLLRWRHREGTAFPTRWGQPARRRSTLVWYRARFGLKPTNLRLSARLLLKDMGYGAAWLNGKYLGLYSRAGYDGTYGLAIPGGWLKSENELLLLEQDGRQPTELQIRFDRRATYLPVIIRFR